MNRYIINIRGTNGAGKTKMAEAFLGRNADGSLKGEDIILTSFEKQNKVSRVTKHVLGRWSAEERTMLVGKYGHANCGGCDTIPTQDLICEAVRRACHYADCRVVVFEGSLVSTIFDRYRQLDLEMFKEGGWRFVWAYLQTPTETCIERVKARTGDGAKTSTIADKARAVAATRTKAHAAGRRVIDLEPGWDADQGVPDGFYQLASLAEY